jgi:riboflavin biosynthesis pyrimidine reductase
MTSPQKDSTARFVELAERKIQAALTAELPPYVTETDARAPELLSVGNAWTRLLFDGDFYLSPPPAPTLPACNLVFVQSSDGNTGARHPSTLGGGESDKHLIYEGLSRVAVDAVLVGAQTVRGGTIVFSAWHPELVNLRASLAKPRHPAQIIATLRGMDVERELIFNVPEVPVFLLTSPDGGAEMRKALSARPWITPITLNGPDQLHAGFEQLRQFGIERISCVGGRHLAAGLIDAGLVQDVYLTTAPRPGGEPKTPISSKPLRGRVIVRKRGTGRETGVTFEHLVVQK